VDSTVLGTYSFYLHGITRFINQTRYLGVIFISSNLISFICCYPVHCLSQILLQSGYFLSLVLPLQPKLSMYYQTVAVQQSYWCPYWCLSLLHFQVFELYLKQAFKHSNESLYLILRENTFLIETCSGYVQPHLILTCPSVIKLLWPQSLVFKGWSSSLCFWDFASSISWNVPALFLHATFLYLAWRLSSKSLAPLSGSFHLCFYHPAPLLNYLIRHLSLFLIVYSVPGLLDNERAMSVLIISYAQEYVTASGM
jgi:hypothetical protein